MDSRSSFRPFPGFSSIYCLTSGGSEQPFHADVEIETSEQNVNITRAEMMPPNPVQARWALGSKKPSDIIWTTFAVSLLVSERVITILRNSGFTGWSTYPVELFGQDGALIPGYYGFSIYGRCGSIDESKAVQIPRIFPGGVFPVWLGLYFDPDTWDGSDLFMPGDNWGSIFVTEEVMWTLKKAKIKPLKFTSLIHCRVFK